MDNTIYLVVITLVIVVLAKLLEPILTQSAGSKSKTSSSAKIDFRYEKIDSLLTATELEFFRALEQAVENNWYAFSKVRLEDIIKVEKGIERKKAYGLRNRIKSRHIDFVLCDKKSLEVLICIELDDSSHQRKDRIARDQFVDKALSVSGIPIIHIPTQKTYSIEDIKSQILGGIQTLSDLQ